MVGYIEMESLEYMLGENYGVIVLQSIIIVLAVIIIITLYNDKTMAQTLESKIDNFKCPEVPECPDCNLQSEGCPACVCEGEGGECPTCPACPACPNTQAPTVDEIVDAIFPGRNKGFTSSGEYFPLDGLGEGVVEPAYSPVTNMVPNYTSGSGVPAAISFSDQMLQNPKSRVGLASQVDPPMATTQGVFTQPSSSQATSDEDTSSTNVAGEVASEMATSVVAEAAVAAL